MIGDSQHAVHSVLEWAGYQGDWSQTSRRLIEFRDWLATEAIQAGAIGPAEPDRLWRRHIADSLTFLALLERVDSVVDVGSGVGLPGIPLAIALPDVEFLLLDRSEKRCVLSRRVVRVLGLDNVAVVQGDVTKMRLPHIAAVTRASLPLREFFSAARHLLPDGHLAVAAGSHGTTEPPDHEAWEIVRIPSEVLGEPGWLAKVSLSA